MKETAQQNVAAGKRRAEIPARLQRLTRRLRLNVRIVRRTAPIEHGSMRKSELKPSDAYYGACQEYRRICRKALILTPVIFWGGGLAVMALGHGYPAQLFLVGLIAVVVATIAV